MNGKGLILYNGNRYTVGKVLLVFWTIGYSRDISGYISGEICP